jgi:hypothetical protein
VCSGGGEEADEGEERSGEHDCGCVWSWHEMESRVFYCKLLNARLRYSWEVSSRDCRRRLGRGRKINLSSETAPRALYCFISYAQRLAPASQARGGRWTLHNVLKIVVETGAPWRSCLTRVERVGSFGEGGTWERVGELLL